MQLNFKRSGSGQPFIILHGVFGSSDNWLSVGKQLSQHFEVFIIDLRNHGDSFHNDEFTHEAMVHDLEDFLAEHSIENPIIMGHSLGGKVAMKFALNHPDKYDKLIVVDIGPKAYPVHHARILEGLCALDIKHIQSRQEADQQLSEYVPQKGVRQFLLKNLERNKEGSYSWKLNLPVIQENIGNIGEGVGDRLYSAKPTLFIRGEKSDYIENKDNIAIVSIFSNSSIKTVKDAGHWVHAEQPEKFLELVLEFVRNE